MIRWGDPRRPSAEVSSPDYSHVTTIDARALRTEDNGPETWSGLQTVLVERTPVKNTRCEPSSKDDMEAVRLRAFDPPGSPVNRYNVIASPQSVKNAG
jgi:hypothetical protein